ncbi:hypothetical protein ACFVHB_27455 [Kitasatospora sp. NPDC127111]|uniref:hypothetical protein n=1 Tax=Kitasatospora sp. NPDC127111 TaxID=3345363 RepID=UPI00363E73E3
MTKRGRRTEALVWPVVAAGLVGWAWTATGAYGADGTRSAAGSTYPLGLTAGHDGDAWC